MFRFEHIDYLWWLCTIPVIIVLFLFFWQWRKKAFARLADLHLADKLIPNRSNRKPIVKFLLLCGILSLLVVAIAGPQLGSKMETAKREGIDLIIALDVSNSMLAEDLTPSRLSNAKRAMEKLVDNLHGDRIGMIVFAGRAYVQLPLTTDYAAAKMFIKTVNTNSVNTQGTAIGTAIELALESFDKQSQTSKAVVIITDGENHEDDAIEQAKLATELGVSVHTIGMGSVKGAPIPVYKGRDRIGFRKDQNGQAIVTKLNEKMLEEISDAGNGIFVRASNANAGLEYIFKEIENMEKVEYGSKVFTDYEDRFQFLLGAALLFLILEMLISDKKTAFIRKLNLFGKK